MSGLMLDNFYHLVYSFYCFYLRYINNVSADVSFDLLQVFHAELYVSSRVRNETPEEGGRMHRPKRCEYDKDEYSQ